jgi:hypothetical protein
LLHEKLAFRLHIVVHVEVHHVEVAITNIGVFGQVEIYLCI